MATKSNVVLIGMPGSGKSTVGVLLAKQASLAFVDTDLLIQTQQERPLQDIVDNDGYQALRQIEEDVLVGLNVERHVVSTGGSAVYSHAAMQHLKTTGTVIFLDVDVPTLESRVSNYATRGLAKCPDQTFDELFAERRTLYKRYADHVIDCSPLSLDEACEAVLRVL